MATFRGGTPAYGGDPNSGGPPGSGGPPNFGSAPALAKLPHCAVSFLGCYVAERRLMFWCLTIAKANIWYPRGSRRRGLCYGAGMRM